jgi:hypothetical protein
MRGLFRGASRWRHGVAGIAAVAAFVAVATADVISPDRAQASEIEENYSISVTGFYGDLLFNPDNSQVMFSQSNQIEQQMIEVRVTDSDGEYMWFNFASRDSSDEYLKVGYYGDAQRYPFMDPGRPGISISHLGFCDGQTGNFEVRDLGLDGLRITRIWITFTRYCNNAFLTDQRPSFGEIKLGYPPSSYEVSPSVVRWPAETEPGRSTFDVPVAVRPTGSDEIGVVGVSVVGPSRAAFPIRGHDCTGILGSTGCTVLVGFAPTAPGPHHAQLLVATTAGTAVTTLDGSGALGSTQWLIDTDHQDLRPDEHIELPWAFAWGVPSELSAQGAEADGTLWNTRLTPEWPETFAEGGHYVANPDRTGMRVSLARGNAACVAITATADIANLAFAGPDDRLTLLDLSMQVHCEGNPGDIITSRLRFRDRDDLTGPPQVSDVQAVRNGESVSLSWSNPASADLARTIVRWYPGEAAPQAPDAGNLATFDLTDAVSFDAPDTGPVAVSIWTYDETGNAGPRHSLVVA